MRNGFYLLVAGAVAFLSGCAGPRQPPVPLSQELLAPGGRVGVAMTRIPKPNTEFPGAGCLLCMATAEAAHQSLTAYVQSLATDDLARVKDEFADALRKRGVNAIVIAEPLDLESFPERDRSGANAAHRDFSSLRKKYQIDRVVVLSIGTHGVSRSYSSYIPTADPRAFVRGTAYAVNLTTNSYEWYKTVAVSKFGAGKWDEPPKYPGLTNMYYEAVESCRDSFLDPLNR